MKNVNTNTQERETCKLEWWTTEGDHARVGFTCGHDCMVETVNTTPNYCPVCGKAVKE